MKKEILLISLFILIFYIFVASITFKIRHPWATDMECVMNFKKVLLFQKVDYKEIKGKYEKS